MRLTKEQSDMVAENHNLIFWYINKSNLEMSEYYDLLAIELCNTIVHYDESKGSLGNYFKLRADGVVYKEYRKTQAQKRLHEKVPLLDNLHVLKGTSTICEDLEISEWMNGNGKDILRLKADGWNQTEIAEMMNTTQSQISKILKKLKVEYHDR